MERITMDLPDVAERAPREHIEDSYDFYTSVYVTDYDGVMREIEIWFIETDGFDGRRIEFVFCYADASDQLHRVMDLDIEEDSLKTGLWYISEVHIYRNFQGLGLAAKLYASLLQLNPSLILGAGYCQSPGGRKLWCDLSMIEGIAVFGGYGDTARTFRPFDVVPDMDYRELWGEDGTDIYESCDSGLYACKTRAA